MILKTILSLVIIFTLYVLMVFNLPSLANTLGNTLWLTSFNEKIVEFKSSFDETTSKIPSGSEFISWAVDLKNDIVDWVDKTKDKIDNFRDTMSGVEETYNEIKGWYDSVKEFIDNNSGALDTLKWTAEDINKIKESLNNTWTVTN